MPTSPDGREPVNTEPSQPNTIGRLMQERLTRRELFGRTLGLGAAVGAAAILRPSESLASNNPVEDLPPVEPTPEAKGWMDLGFEEQARITKENIDGFTKWIEEEGGAEEFHQTFADFRSEIQNAMNFGLTPPELVTDVMDAVIGDRGPIGYPADFTSGEAKKEDKFFGKVAIDPVSTGQEVNDRLLIGGEADVVIFGLTFHDFTSETGAHGKVVVVHFGGANESQAWNASGFYNVLWPNDEFSSRMSQFRVETDASNTQRLWPYDWDVKLPSPQVGQAGINEMLRCIGNGMASINIGSTFNYDSLMQFYQEQGISLDYLAPDFTSEQFTFDSAEVGLKLLQRLQLHAVDAMIKEQEISGRELGIVQFDYQNQTKQDYIGVEAMKSLFPDAADTKKWPKIKGTSYFLDRPTLTTKDVHKLPTIGGPKRFAYPNQFPQGLAGIVNPVR